VPDSSSPFGSRLRSRDNTRPSIGHRFKTPKVKIQSTHLDANLVFEPLMHRFFFIGLYRLLERMPLKTINGVPNFVVLCGPPDLTLQVDQ
jgi:hypothetical protein